MICEEAASVNASGRKTGQLKSLYGSRWMRTRSIFAGVIVFIPIMSNVEAMWGICGEVFMSHEHLWREPGS
jgi:hypothetical protein